MGRVSKAWRRLHHHLKTNILPKAANNIIWHTYEDWAGVWKQQRYAVIGVGGGSFSNFKNLLLGNVWGEVQTVGMWTTPAISFWRNENGPPLYHHATYLISPWPFCLWLTLHPRPAPLHKGININDIETNSGWCCLSLRMTYLWRLLKPRKSSCPCTASSIQLAVHGQLFRFPLFLLIFQILWVWSEKHKGNRISKTHPYVK